MRRTIFHVPLAIAILAIAILGVAPVLAQQPAKESPPPAHPTPGPPPVPPQQPAKESPPPAAPAKGFVLPQVRKLDLAGGMRVRLVDYGAIPKVTVMLVEQTGNADEAPNETWLADLTTRLMQEGTSSRSPQQIARQV